MIVSSLILFFLSPLAKTTDQFFKAINNTKAPNTMVLTGSLIISWIFAKSITNAANLGLEFGILGGVAYAGYYLSFAIAGILIQSLILIIGGASNGASLSSLGISTRSFYGLNSSK